MKLFLGLELSSKEVCLVSTSSYLHLPYHIYLQEGLIAVSDYENKCVSLFDPDGQYQARLGAGKLLGPKGVTVTREGDTVVVDNKVTPTYTVMSCVVM